MSFIHAKSCILEFLLMLGTKLRYITKSTQNELDYLKIGM
uniref:Uncharacterized protein n=1 Tax=Arundo donax TaxID=35708 RepID=A0A0A9C3U5_ARUDO